MRSLRLPLVLIPLHLAIACEPKKVDNRSTDTRSSPDTTTTGDTGDTAVPEPVDEDGDGSPAGEDCDDSNPEVHPGTEELCDGIDNDCDGGVDETLVGPTWYPDQDGDGVGAGTGEIQSCVDPGPGWTAVPGDCDDENPEMGLPLWYYDFDRDGYGDQAGTPVETCEDPGEAFVYNALDCDDRDDLISPAAEDIPVNGIDEDCDGADAPSAINKDGVTTAACPPLFPADAAGGSIHLDGRLDFFDSYQYTITYEGASTYEGLDVWVVYIHGSALEDGGSYQVLFTTRLAVTCEEDGVHLVYEDRRDIVAAHASTTSETFREFSDRPLLFPVDPAYGVDWAVPGAALQTDQTLPTLWDTDLYQTTLSMRNEVEVEIDGAPYTSRRFLVTSYEGTVSNWYFVEGIGLVKLNDAVNTVIVDAEELVGF